MPKQSLKIATICLEALIDEDGEPKEGMSAFLEDLNDEGFLLVIRTDDMSLEEAEDWLEDNAVSDIVVKVVDSKNISIMDIGEDETEEGFEKALSDIKGSMTFLDLEKDVAPFQAKRSNKGIDSDEEEDDDRLMSGAY